MNHHKLLVAHKNKQLALQCDVHAGFYNDMTKVKKSERMWPGGGVY